MENIRLIDVTLRDGGYQTGFNFSQEFIRSILTELDQSGLHYIEVGYRNGAFKSIAGAGPSAMCDREYLDFCKQWVQKAKLTVMVHPRNLQQKDIQEMHDCGVQAIRVCFPSHDPMLGYRWVELIKKYDFELFVNFTRITEQSPEEIAEHIARLQDFGLQAIYLADSNGSMDPSSIRSWFSYLKNHCELKLGFHAHDNLFLGQANALSAIESGVEFIDASLNGFGKGAGNLRTEGIVSYLHAKGIDGFDLIRIFDAAQLVLFEYQAKKTGLSIKDRILGAYDLSQDDAAILGEFQNMNDYLLHAKKHAWQKQLAKANIRAAV